MLKRLFDFVSSLAGIILLLPLFLLVAFFIAIGSPGPIFYMGERIGKGGRPFKMYKFRTMVINADKIGGPSTAADDPRLTKVGLWLKKYQLDELPQLFNVLKGDMSIVGPRPEVKMYIDMMTDEERNAILSLQPGMTDFASLWNFHEGEILKGTIDPEKAYQEKIWPEKKRLQLKYVKEQNFLVDLKIIFKTIAKIFR